jgi:hypothetical protein
MEIKLTPQESENFFYNALCNGVMQMGYYDLELTYEPSDYASARFTLTKEASDIICYQDVLMQILRDGKSLTMVDLEAEESYSINLQDVHERVQQTPVHNLLEMIEGRDDATTADCIIQQVFFSEIIFG